MTERDVSSQRTPSTGHDSPTSPTVRGIRIEDDILVTDSDPLIMTLAAPKEVDAVQSAVGAA